MAPQEVMGEAILSLGTDAVFLVEPAKLAVVGVNRGFTRALGYPTAEAGRLTLTELVAAEPARVDALVEGLERDGDTNFGTGPYRHRDGRVVELASRAGKTSVGGRPYYCFVARDPSVSAGREAREQEDLRRRILTDAAFEALGITEQGRVYGPSPMGFAVEAVRLALEDAGLTRADLDGVLVNPGLTWGANATMASFGLQQAMGLRDVRFSAAFGSEL